VKVVLTVDGVERAIDVEPRMTLADALRDECDAVGVHLGCEQGVCGACTVLVDGAAVRSCLLLAVQCAGRPIGTVAGLAPDGELHPVQRALAEHHGLQCGFCTPGFAVLLTAALADDPDLDDAGLLELVSSNVCRCTGYQGILAAARDARDQLGAARPDRAGPT
jgi:aerobic carbon-monoxide dehydrogenase small subunit